MALVGPITLQGSTSSASTWIFKTVVTETAVDVVAKTHTVKVENYLGRHQNASNSSEVNWFGGNYTTKFTVNGETKSISLYKYAKDISPGTYVLIGSETFVVTETSSPFKINVEGTMSTSQFTPRSASASGEVTLSVLHQSPIVSIDSISELNNTLANTGIPGDTFVPGLSKKRFNIGAATFDNAKIVRYGVHIATDNYHSETTPIDIDFSTNDMFWGRDENQNIGTRIRFTAKDDAGTTGTTQWSTYNVIPYDRPNLIKTSSSVKRNGQTTGKATLSLSGTFFNGKIGSQNNSITLQFKYWALNTNEPAGYNNIPSSAYSISNNNITMTNWNIAIGGTVITDLNKSMSYNFKIRAVDAFGSESVITLVCAKGEWLRAIFKDRIDFKKITIGGNPIIESGETDNGSYIKYYDGTMITRQSYERTISGGWVEWGSLWTKPVELEDFPETFVEPPTPIIWHESAGYLFSIAPNNTDGLTHVTSASRPTDITLIRGSGMNAETSFIVHVVAIGKWK